MAERSQTADEVARQRAEAAQAAQYAQLAAEEAARQRAIQGYSQAAAQMVEPIAGQVQQGYADAGQRTANYAKGFSIGFNQAVSGNADQANAYLAKQGSPQHVQSQGAPGADVIYGTGGYIPASTLEREGAAFSAAARMLPSTQLGYGAQALSQMQQDVAGRRAALDANKPALEAQFRQQIFENNLARQKFAQDKAQAKVSAAQNKAQLKQQAHSAWVQEQYLLNTQRQTDARITGVDPVTGQPTYESKQDRLNRLAKEKAAKAAAAKVAKTAAAKKTAARNAAVQRKNDKTIAAVDAADEWVRTQTAPGTKSVPVPGRGTPKKSHTVKVGTQTIQYYVAKPGYVDPTTGKPSSVTVTVKDAMMEPVYQTVPVTRETYAALRQKLVVRLTRELRRFGYKPLAIRYMAEDILNEHMLPEGAAPNPEVVTPGRTGPADKPRG